MTEDTTVLSPTPATSVKFSRNVDNALFSAADNVVIDVECIPDHVDALPGHHAYERPSKMAISIPYEPAGLRAALHEVKSRAHGLDEGEEKTKVQAEAAGLQEQIDAGAARKAALEPRVRQLQLELHRQLFGLGYGMNPGRYSYAHHDAHFVATINQRSAEQMQQDFDTALERANAELTQNALRNGSVGFATEAVVQSRNGEPSGNGQSRVA